MYELPAGYTCVTRSNDGSYLYGYTNNTRDTYTVNGFTWQKIATSSYYQLPDSSVCLSGNQYPLAFTTSLILPAVLIVLCFFKVILNMIMGVRR